MKMRITQWIRNDFLGAIIVFFVSKTRSEYVTEIEWKQAKRIYVHWVDELSPELRKHEISNSGRRQLYNYLGFYRTYPQIVRTVPHNPATLGFNVCDFSTSVSKTGSGDIWMSYVLDKEGWKKYSELTLNL